MQFFLLRLLINNQQNNNRKQGGKKMNEKEATRKLSKQRMTKLLQINNQLVDISRMGASTPKVLIDGYVRVGEMLDRLIIEEAKIQEATL